MRQSRFWFAQTVCGVVLGGIAVTWSASAAAESMIVPRLGYPSTMPKRIFLDFTPEPLPVDIKPAQTKTIAKKDDPKAAAKAAKEEKKRTKQLAKETEQKQNHTQMQANTDASNVTTQADPDALGLQPEQSSQFSAEGQKKSKLLSRLAKPFSGPSQDLSKETDSEKLSDKAGTFFLVDLKQNRVMYKEPSRLQPTGTTQPGQYFVEFKELPVEGVFDLAVRGSGYRSKSPIWVSRDVYWDALSPMLADLSKAHCPPNSGKVYILQQCSVHQVRSTLHGAMGKEDQVTVRGGWYSPQGVGNATGIVKNGRDIAQLTQTLLNIYLLNPEAFKSLALSDPSYASSRYSDLLDEANWGLQYLLSTQLPDGSFSHGIENRSATASDSPTRWDNWLMAADTETTAYATLTLATAVQAFKKEDVGYSLELLRAADKGWRYLERRSDALPLWRMMVTSALMHVSDDPVYAKAFTRARSQVSEVPVEIAFLMGNWANDLPATSTLIPAGIIPSKYAQTLTPWIVQLQQQNPSAVEPLSQWITDLYGYDKIPLIKDPKLVIGSVWSDPLEWAAYKTGELVTRYGHKLADDGVVKGASTDPKTIDLVSKMEKEARQRLNSGYKTLNLNPHDRALLAYALALLNQQAAVDQVQIEREAAKSRRSLFFSRQAEQEAQSAGEK